MSRVRKGPIIGGAVTFGSLYLLSAFAAAIGEDASRNENELAALWIPIVGPFVQMAKTDSATANMFLALDGAGQGVGAALLIWGLVSPKTVLVRNDLAGVDVRVTPIATKVCRGSGLPAPSDDATTPPAGDARVRDAEASSPSLDVIGDGCERACARRATRVPPPR